MTSTPFGQASANSVLAVEMDTCPSCSIVKMINVNRNCPTVVTGSATSELGRLDSRLLPELNKTSKAWQIKRGRASYAILSFHVTGSIFHVSHCFRFRPRFVTRSPCDRPASGSNCRNRHMARSSCSRAPHRLGVQLPEWRYPVVCDTTNGQLAYDNFGGRWESNNSSIASCRGMRLRSADWKRGGTGTQ